MCDSLIIFWEISRSAEFYRLYQLVSVGRSSLIIRTYSHNSDGDFNSQTIYGGVGGVNLCCVHVQYSVTVLNYKFISYLRVYLREC